MAWIELHQALRKHPKTLHLAALLELQDPDHARVKLENLWLWALDYCLHGRLTVASRPLSAMEIASASDWHGDATVWLRSLIASGWIDEIQGGQNGKTLYLHDWQDYGGKLLQSREADRERKQIARSGGRPPDVRVDGGGTVPTVPYRTVPREEESTIQSGAAPPPPSSLAPQGGQEEAEVRETVQRYGAWGHPNAEKKAEGIRELRELGCSHDYIRNGAQVNKPNDVGFWDVVKALKAVKETGGRGRQATVPGSSPDGNGTPTRVNGNPSGFKPPVLQEPRDVVQKRQDAARAQVDKLIAKMDPDRLASITGEAQNAAVAAKIPKGRQMESFIKGQLRMRVAKEHGIEGM